jgi:hypothetical protein
LTFVFFGGPKQLGKESGGKLHKKVSQLPSSPCLSFNN